jgi:hypothetical protein
MTTPNAKDANARTISNNVVNIERPFICESFSRVADTSSSCVGVCSQYRLLQRGAVMRSLRATMLRPGAVSPLPCNRRTLFRPDGPHMFCWGI